MHYWRLLIPVVAVIGVVAAFSEHTSLNVRQECYNRRVRDSPINSAIYREKEQFSGSNQRELSNERRYNILKRERTQYEQLRRNAVIRDQAGRIEINNLKSGNILSDARNEETRFQRPSNHRSDTTRLLNNRQTTGNRNVIRDSARGQVFRRTPREQRVSRSSAEARNFDEGTWIFLEDSSRLSQPRSYENRRSWAGNERRNNANNEYDQRRTIRHRELTGDDINNLKSDSTRNLNNENVRNKVQVRLNDLKLERDNSFERESKMRSIRFNVHDHEKKLRVSQPNNHRSSERALLRGEIKQMRPSISRLHKPHSFKYENRQENQMLNKQITDSQERMQLSKRSDSFQGERRSERRHFSNRISHSEDRLSSVIRSRNDRSEREHSLYGRDNEKRVRTGETEELVSRAGRRYMTSRPNKPSVRSERVNADSMLEWERTDRRTRQTRVGNSQRIESRPNISKQRSDTLYGTYRSKLDRNLNDENPNTGLFAAEWNTLTLYTVQGIYICAVLIQFLGGNRKLQKPTGSVLRWWTVNPMKSIKVD